MNVAGNAATSRQVFGHYTLSAVTVMEIVQGFQRKQSFRRLQAFVASLATEEVIRIESPKDRVCIGDGGPRSAAPVDEIVLPLNERSTIEPEFEVVQDRRREAVLYAELQVSDAGEGPISEPRNAR